MDNSINNGKVREKKKLIEQFKLDYERGGLSNVIDMANAYNKNHILVIPFENCKACETDTPSIDHECLCCGQETKPLPNINKLIGYQIVSNDGKNELPKCFFSFEVIEDVGIAELWLIYEKKNPEHGEFRWVLTPIFEGDIEEPTFINSL